MPLVATSIASAYVKKLVAVGVALLRTTVSIASSKRAKGMKTSAPTLTPWRLSRLGAVALALQGVK